MNRARWIFAGATLAAAVTVLGTSQTVSACSCAAVSDRQAFAGADAVFTGELVDVVTADPPGDVISSGDIETFVFEVDAVFKGEVSPEQEILTARDGASCGLEIAGRGPFVVFAHKGDDEHILHSGLCTNTRALADRPVPPRWGAGQPPVVPETVPPTVPDSTPETTVDESATAPSNGSDSGTSSTVIAGSVLIGAVAVGGGGLLLARRRPPAKG
jgi:hypothetical protein